MTEARLGHADPSVRLRAALDAGTAADAARAAELVSRCAHEPDFFVRDMLTWALTRLPAPTTVPLLMGELRSPIAQARAQALHTLSKIGPALAGQAWRPVLALIDDGDEDVARAAWRAAVALVPFTEREAVATALARRLGRGGREVRLSLSRALLALDEDGLRVLGRYASSPDGAVREHVRATLALHDDPDTGLAAAIAEASRIRALGDAK